MNDFLRLIISHLSDAIPLAIIAVLLCSIGVLVAYGIFRVKYKNTRKFPLPKVILWLIFTAYVTVLLSVTILRGDGYRYANFHLFRAWREAWNLFSFKNWANVLLNVALFVPLGVLLPCVHKRFREWYVMLGGGFAFTLTIEILQAITGKGLFDVDDLFANTLGAVFGYGFFMAIFLLKTEKNTVRIFAYSAIPLTILLCVSSIFVVYAVKDYGNLRDAPIYRISTKGVEWSAECELSDKTQTVSIYKALMHDKNSSDAFAKSFLKGKINGDLDISYYDRETYYMDHREHTLIVSHLDRSYTYTYRPDGKKCVPAEKDRKGIEALLADFGIDIPDSAVFTYEGDGWHEFIVPRDEKLKISVGGELRCRYSSEGFIYAIHNNLVSYDYCAEEQIISEAEAFARMKRGDFLGGTFEMLSPRKVTVLSCEMEYAVDSKGFYQPVYMFRVMYDGVEDQLRIMIPALS